MFPNHVIHERGWVGPDHNHVIFGCVTFYLAQCRKKMSEYHNNMITEGVGGSGTVSQNITEGVRGSKMLKSESRDLGMFPY